MIRNNSETITRDLVPRALQQILGTLPTLSHVGSNPTPGAIPG